MKWKNGRTAALVEIQSLEKNGTWLIVDKSEAKGRILPGTWVFRRSARRSDQFPSSRPDTVYVAISKTLRIKKHSPQLLPGVPCACFSSCHSLLNGKHVRLTSVQRLCKHRSMTRCGFISHVASGLNQTPKTRYVFDC
jgi:hypothetical protein